MLKLGVLGVKQIVLVSSTGLFHAFRPVPSFLAPEGILHLSSAGDMYIDMYCIHGNRADPAVL